MSLAARILVSLGVLVALTQALPVAAMAQGRAGASGDVRTIEVTAERFRFVPSEIEVVQGERVRLRLRSLDVPHGFEVPDLGLSASLRPGQDTEIEFVAEAPGRYPFQCSVFCGAGHGQMTGALVVLPGSGEGPVGERPAADTGLLDPLEPDFALVSLPTTLAMPPNRLAFRLVHRFTRPLDGGVGFGNLLEDLFGFDSAALIGLEFRYGVTPRLQVGIHRNNTRNIQLFGKYRLFSGAANGGPTLEAIASVEGLDNFREEHAPSFGAILSQPLGGVASVYIQPLWVENADNEQILHPQAGPFDETDDDAFVLGVGTRIRVRDTVTIVAEFLPRLAGFDQGEEYASVGIEKRAGGHVFQLNFSNSVATTPAQLAQGASTNWFIGFNISRRFY